MYNIYIYIIYVLLCAIWDRPLFGVCMDVQMHANALFFLPSCRFYLFVLVSMPIEQVNQMSNIRMPFKQVKTSNLMTLNVVS